MHCSEFLIRQLKPFENLQQRFHYSRKNKRRTNHRNDLRCAEISSRQSSLNVVSSSGKNAYCLHFPNHLIVPSRKPCNLEPTSTTFVFSFCSIIINVRYLLIFSISQLNIRFLESQRLLQLGRLFQL